MVLVRTKIQRWGNSLAIRLTGPARSIPNFVEDMPVNLEVSEDVVQIIPQKKAKKLLFTEANLLENLSPLLAHADELINPLPSELP